MLNSSVPIFEYTYTTAVWDSYLYKDIQKLSILHAKRWDDAYSDMLHILNIATSSQSF